MRTKLSVNINKVATIRNARGGNNPDVIKVIGNAIRWANPIYRQDKLEAPMVKKPLED